jgi:prepilin-type N-terminal cleavage/methylation domain-containing protein
MHSLEKGFTLIEILVVIGITGLVTVFLLKNFSRSQQDLDRVAQAVVAGIRDAQARAGGSRQYQSTYRCGYGIHAVSSTEIDIYVGPNATTANCATENRNYDVNDTINLALLPPIRITVPTVVVNSDSTPYAPIPYFPDIFFEPPNPSTYINNSASLSATPARILLTIVGTNCSNVADCRAICISPSGQIDVQRDLNCP